MTKAEEDLIIAEQNQSREIILKAIEKEKCELLGIIQGKDKAIKDLEWQLKQVTEDNDYYQAENERLEKENADLQKSYEELYNSMRMIKSQRNGLTKENAELKEEVKNNEDLATVAYMQGAERQKKKAQKQLTKAKELLRKFIETSNPIYFEEDRQKVKVEAEQFLKEVTE